MGSQSVTNFSEVRMKRIQSLVKDYSPKSSKAPDQVAEIGKAAITLGASSPAIPKKRRAKGRKGKGEGGIAATIGSRPANEFLQALSSRSVETALGLILYLADELKRQPDEAYQKYEVSERPLGSLGNVLATAFENMLSKSQEKTDASFAVKEAIPKTMIDIISRAFPREREPADVDRKKFAEAFSKVDREDVITAFLENVAGSLINQVIEATRGSLSPRRVEEVKQKVRQDFVPKIIQDFKALKRK